MATRAQQAGKAMKFLWRGVTAIGLFATLAGCAAQPPNCGCCNCVADVYANRPMEAQVAAPPGRPIEARPVTNEQRLVPVESKYAIAVTKPAPYNEFPVTYRVQVPDTDPRLRYVDRVIYR